MIHIDSFKMARNDAFSEHVRNRKSQSRIQNLMKLVSCLLLDIRHDLGRWASSSCK